MNFAFPNVLRKGFFCTFAIAATTTVCTTASASTTLWEENFNDSSLNNKGAMGTGSSSAPVIDMAGISRWSIDISEAELTASSDWFRVNNGRFEARDVDGPAVWTSELIDISGQTDVAFSLVASESGDHESTDYIDVAYSIDGGNSFTTIANWDDLGSSSHTLIGDIPNDGDWVTATITQPIPDANWLQIKVTFRNNAGSEYLRLDNIVVSNGNDNGGGNGGNAQCGEPADLIHQIQGTGAVSPLLGSQVTIEGVVVGDFQSTSDGLRGFFVQEEDQDADTDSSTSEGIFIFDNGFGVNVSEGDVVRVRGSVTEYLGLTELNQINSVIICDDLTGTASPAQVSLPESFNGELEHYEGMLIEVQQDMLVAQNYFLGRYGQITLASPDDNGLLSRVFNPTNQYVPLSPEAIALADENSRRFLILDDGYDISSLGDNPDPVPYLGAPPAQVIRSGDTVSNLVGVLDYGRINSAPNGEEARDYRLHPVTQPVFTQQNFRQDLPDEVEGSLKVASFNVLNYFNGDGQGNFNSNPRGARTGFEFDRQTQKLVNAILGMDADIIGLMEIENDGYDSLSAISDLVSALNQAAGNDTYRFVDPGTADWGGDVITVGAIYQPAKVTIAPDTIVAGLDTGEFIQVDGRHRKPLVVTFRENESGEDLTIVVNHLKSKGRLTGIPEDEDQGDGQGRNNFSRTNAANELVEWLLANPTGSNDGDILILGDLNAYAKEDPISVIETAGYENIIAKYNGSSAYSFTFDGQSGYLDHALANQSLAPQIVGATEWHINTDEPAVIDYGARFNPPGYFDGSTPFRASDHDPVIVGINLNTPVRGDLDGDKDVDRDDLQVIRDSLRDTAKPGDPRDLDEDGVITSRDMRQLTLLCTRPGCATE